MALSRQQLEQQLVAAHRSGNVQAAQQAAYAIRAYDQAPLSADVPSVNAPPPIERVPKPTFGNWLDNVSAGIGQTWTQNLENTAQAVRRGVTSFTQDPLKASAAAVMGVLEPWRRGLTQPAQAAKDVGAGIVETGKEMYKQATGGPISLGTLIGQNIDIMPGPNMLGGKRKPTMTVLERNGERAVAPKAAAPARPRVATWFSGGGTVESALPNHERVMAAEYNPQINEQANKSFGTSFPARDVNKIDPQELKAAKPDLFHASPVCKNFSAAKTMRGATELDRESANSVANAIRVATPPVVTIENVPQYADTALFKHITDALDDKGYKWDVVIHDAADYGAPQSRKRMLLRAVREGELPPLPPKTGGKDWFGAVSDLLPDAPDAIIPPVERRRLDDMIAAGKLDPSKPIITMGGSGFKGTWSAANAGGVAPTLKAANEKPRVIMPDGTVKAVTGRMMARLMGLGDDVPVPENQTLAKTVLGNGVSGDVTKALIAPLLNRKTN